MKEFKYVITDPEGIHARPAGELVKKCKGYASKITMIKDGKAANAAKILAVMSLGVKKGHEVTFQIEGADEATAAAELEAFMKENL
ncbi:MAG: HPr family phosphocarrier protein [Lachnospiraceae bacterium]|jgi:phosphocarrier protein|nr:HPr family phosphocarrier protein [Lachnospiraceae bacterium]MEE1109654.1 HPr family phosphocarrier protein [Lachnospiraceae bacterium]MEE3378590.1 HPr family phosphocarrier protein [Lachnospiraceae bacterium]MEE3437353.1 HPr family phosphocarrier protein [Lachnospiraceae bacterium]MEE3456779.1 HPr family phosphocarrier protein [Lachnospiraceae bacterium]